MSRRGQRARGSEKRDRWLISYADLVTLLFALFVVLYAAAVNPKRYEHVAAGIGQVFGTGLLPGSRELVPRPRPRGDTLKSAGALDGVEAALAGSLRHFIRSGQVRLTRSESNVSIEISAGLLFPSSSAELASDAKAVLASVAVALSADAGSVKVIGHTDDRPIASTVFPSNWELSAVRASAVARQLKEHGVDESRLTVVGEAAKAPLESNETEAGRSKNRRVTISINAGSTAG